jgi:peptidoglycan/LPS O-acetylase OafA/YrhL
VIRDNAPFLEDRIERTGRLVLLPAVPRTSALPRLTSLRIFAAFVVVAFHLSTWEVLHVPGISSVGYVGVGFFFVLSGLVLAWSTSRRLPVRTFYRRRFARVWPSHAVVLAVVALVPVVAVTRGWAEAVPNLLLVQAWWSDPSVVFAFNGVSWSLACEAFFYLTFPFTASLLGRLDHRWQWLLAGLFLAGSAVLGLVVPLLAYHNPLARYGEFLLGVVAGLTLRSGWRPRPPISVVGVALVAGVLLSAVVPFPLPNVVLAGPFLLVLLCAVERDVRSAGGWLRSAPMIFAGEASFALYLVHETVILNLRRVLSQPAWVNAAIIVAASALAAVALHLLVERPMNRVIRGGRNSVALAEPEEPIHLANDGTPPTCRQADDLS